jgi:hypothetical protein
MPPRKKPTRRHPVAAPLDASLQSITLLVGQIGGELKSHIAAVTHDRAEREDDRRESASYRKEVRDTLGDLRDGINKIPGLTTRIENLEKISIDYKSFRNKLAGALLVIGFFWALIAEKIKKVLS